MCPKTSHRLLEQRRPEVTPEKTEGMVLRIVEFSETSCVVWWYTREFGRINTLAKGAYRRRSPYEGAIDLLAISRLVFLSKSSEGLELLTEARLEHSFRAGRHSLNRLLCGYHIVELVTRWFDAHDPHPFFYDRMREAVRLIDQNGFLPRIVTGLELALLRSTGYEPAWDQCVNCGAPQLSTPRVSFSTLEGGVICSRCRAGRRQIVSVRLEIVEFLQRLARAESLDSNQERELDLQGGWGEVRGLMGQVLQHRLGAPLKILPMLSFLARSKDLQ